MTTGGYTLIESPYPRQQLVHVHPAGDELGRVFHPTLAINAAAAPFLAAFEQLDAPKRPRWAAARKQARADYEAFSVPLPTPGAVQMERVARILSELLPDDAILTNGAGNYTSFFHRYFPYKRYKSQLGPTCGAMGYGLPAAIGARVADKQRPIVALAGDGCFLMNGQELATAVQYGQKLTVLVVDNGSYGTIRMHQEKHYPGRVSATALRNPDFAALARAYGAHGETVLATAEFAPALQRCLAHDGVSLIHLKTDPEAITPTTTLTAIRKAARP